MLSFQKNITSSYFFYPLNYFTAIVLTFNLISFSMSIFFYYISLI